MEHTFSFRYIKLGVATIFLLVSSLLPGVGKYFLMVIGGIALMTAFASFGNYDYREVPSKLGYKIMRYALAVFLLVLAGIQIYVQITMPNTIHYSPYSTVVDIALIAYLIMYKPSNNSSKGKILKLVGYTAILVGVNALQNSQKEVEYLTYTGNEINWDAISLSSIVMIIGIILIILSSNK